jgi:photosystem II stability/assembly factor-like uncharacterized protein
VRSNRALWVAATGVALVVAVVATAILVSVRGPATASATPAGVAGAGSAAPAPSSPPSATPLAAGFGGGPISPLASPGQSLTPEQAAAVPYQFGVTRSGAMWAERDGRLLISTDDGITWTDHPLPQAAQDNYCSIIVVDASTAFVCSGSYRTTDGGKTWRHGADAPMTTGVYDTEYFVDAQTGFVICAEPFGGSGGPAGPGDSPATVGMASEVDRTTDGGATWQTISTSARLLDPVLALDADTLWTGVISPNTNVMINKPMRSIDPTARPLLSVSRDGGVTWTAVTLPGLDASTVGSMATPEPTELLADLPTFISPTEGFVAVNVYPHRLDGDGVGNETRIYATGDGGRTWNQVMKLPGDGGASPVFLDAQHWFLPIDDVVYETRNGGQTSTATTAINAGLPGGTPDPSRFWTADGVHMATLVDLADQSTGVVLSSDGGKTWRLADFTGK